MEWFGENWNAPINDTPHVDTPVGDICAKCERLIKNEDQGFMIPHYMGSAENGDDNFIMMAWHKDCLLEGIIPNYKNV